MAEEWQPSDTDLQGIAQVLEQSQTADNAVHAQIQQTIMGMHANPDFGRYLVFIMCSQGGVPDELRALAGLILKENIRMHRYNDGCLGYVKAMIVGPLSDPHPSVRHFAGIVVTTIISYTDLNDWPAILPELASRLNGESPAELLDGAFSALDMICEDSHEKMDSEELGWPLNDLVPRLMAFIGHPTAKYRRSALRCLNRFIVHNMPQILVTKLDELLPALSELASDPDDEVRKEVCEALDNLMQARFDFMAPHMASIIEFFLQASQDEEPLVACQAIDFWSSYTDCLSRLKEDQQLYYEQLKDAFPRLIPLLVQKMVYSAEEIDDLMESAQEDENEADRPEDIKPYLLKSKAGGASAGGAGGEGEDDEDDDADDNSEVTNWGVRQAAAASLDHVAMMAGNDLLPHVLPLIQQCLEQDGPEQWPLRESGILVIGALSDGCGGIVDHLPELFPFILTMLKEPIPPVREIAAWTLGQYSGWVVHTSQEVLENCFNPLRVGLLDLICDKNKKVQKSACAAFATFCDEAGELMAPYLDETLPQLMYAYGKFQEKNMVALYDAISTLCAGVGEALNEDRHAEVLLPPLIERWNAFADDDRRLLPIFECLQDIGKAMGMGFQSLAPNIFERCVRIIENVVIMKAAAEHAEEVVDPDMDFCVCALDLLSALIEGLGQGIDELLSQSGSLVALVVECLRDEEPSVRQSAFAVVGDMATHCVQHLIPALPNIMPLLLGALQQPEEKDICNNASWGIGMLAFSLPAEVMAGYLVGILEAMVPMIAMDRGNRALRENLALSLGRIACVSPEMPASELHQYLKPLCRALRTANEDEEKVHAFRGLCNMLRINPEGMAELGGYAFVCYAFASWKQPPDDLYQEFGNILQTFTEWMGDRWPGFYAQFTPELQGFLGDKFNIK